ncbi:MAG: 3-deoxy-D-manno-octulosonic acid transferase [Candidatus Rokuibacteriota bacterium]|nr:MAG: 3-deoxy-D-manno-octulosonic acid transferase [Candidatus Rokubacteria bacterium]
MYALYTTVVLLGLVVLYVPLAVVRRLTRGVPLNVRARLGYGAPDTNGRRTGWLHAVSVGEAIAATPLIEGLRRVYPELPLVVTTVTSTGAQIVRERFAGLATHRFFPLDLPWVARRVSASINPVFLICMETELWPNTLRAVAARGAPVMIANGRISDRSYRRYRLIRGFLRGVLAQVRVFAMQSDEDARRIIALGAPPERVVVTGNVKTDAAVVDTAGAVDLWRRLLGLAAPQRVWIAGSTHPGEEDMVLEAYRAALVDFPDLVLVLAPRHPERAADVFALLDRRGWRAVRRSELPSRAPHPPTAVPPVIVLDTVGELATLYAVADVVFVGGSLVPLGGHNVLEAAQRRKPVLVGPHTGNFRESASLLESAGAALVVRDAADLGHDLRRLLADPDLRAKMGDAGFEALASRHGAVRETLDLIGRYLQPGIGA